MAIYSHVAPQSNSSCSKREHVYYLYAHHLNNNNNNNKDNNYAYQQRERERESYMITRVGAVEGTFSIICSLVGFGKLK